MESLPAAAPEWAYFLDVDGTLVELADHPDEVEVPPRLPALLATLHQVCGGALALVSGRSLARLDTLLGLPQLPMAGQHGLEWRDAAGASFRYDAALAHVQDMYAGIEPLKVKFPSLVIENKGSSVAVHYRRAPFLAGYLSNHVEGLLAAHADILHLQHGKCVLEVKPRGHDKGSAVRALMAQPPFAGRRPVFIGDDITDEDGFAAVDALGGVSIKIGQGKTCAGHRLPDVSAVMRWLQTLADSAAAQGVDADRSDTGRGRDTGMPRAGQI